MATVGNGKQRQFLVINMLVLDRVSTLLHPVSRDAIARKKLNFMK